MQTSGNTYQFGPFSLDPGERLLLCNGQPISLPPKAFDTLTVLIERRGHLVSKEELLREVWPDSFVEESNLALNVHTLRKMLVDGRSEGVRYIETVPKKGYRFVGEVTLVPADAVLIVEKHTATRIRTEEELETIPDAASHTSVAREAGIPNRRLDRRRLALALALSVSVVVAAAGFVYSRIERRIAPAGVAPIQTLAVLPFKVLPKAGDDDYLGLGLADSLITKLSNDRQVTVRPTSAVRSYEGAERELTAIGRALKVEAVLDGTIQRSGDQLRITTQLVRVSDGSTLWAESFDDQLAHLFSLQDRMYEHAASALRIHSGKVGSPSPAKHQTENQTAYHSYLKGLYFWNKRTEESFDKAIQHYQQAIAVDPGYALAYAGLADCYLLLGVWGAQPPREVMPKAKAAAAKALALDETLAEAHTSLAFATLTYDWNPHAAEQEFKRALELNPGYANAHHWHAYNLAAMQRLPEAIAEIRQAQDLDPLSLSINADVGEILYWAGDYDGAIAQCLKTLEMDETFYSAHFVLGYAYERKGMYGDAVASFEKAATHSANDSWTIGILGRAYGIFGKRAEAQKLLANLNKLGKQRYVSSYDVALIHLGLGEKEEALALLEKACDERAGPLAFIKVEPFFVSLQSDPRFSALLRRIGSPS